MFIFNSDQGHTPKHISFTIKFLNIKSVAGSLTSLVPRLLYFPPLFIELINIADEAFHI